MARVFRDSMGKSIEGKEMRTKHKHCELIHAYADGAEIQIKSGQLWLDIDCPHFYDTEEYRIKPRTAKKEGWINIYKGTRGAKSDTTIYDTKAEARHKPFLAVIATVKVEWEEEVE